MKFFIVNGVPTSGKTTFENYCKEQLDEDKNFREHTYIFSTVDNVKKVAKKIGWDGRKTPRDRKFLSDLKDLLTKYNDYPYRSIKKQIQTILSHADDKLKYYTFFIDVREPDEIARITKDLNAKTICIRRPSVEEYSQSNHADKEVLSIKYDYYIWNDKDMEVFKKNIDEFIKEIKEN